MSFIIYHFLHSIVDVEGFNPLLVESDVGGLLSSSSTHTHSAASLPDPDNKPVVAESTNKTTVHAEGSILSRITSRAGLQKYIKSSIEHMVTDAAHGCRSDIPDKQLIPSSEDKEKDKDSQSAVVTETLTSLARSGKITSTSSLFDIEVHSSFRVNCKCKLHLCSLDIRTG